MESIDLSKLPLIKESEEVETNVRKVGGRFSDLPLCSGGKDIVSVGTVLIVKLDNHCCVILS